MAQELGRRLGIPVYDRELISKAAQDSGFSVEFFEKKDEKRGWASFFSMSFSSNENYMSDSGLFKIQSETIRRIAEHGSAIIVGRCSDYILRDMDCCVDVFLTSPEEVRAERVVERERIPFDKAMEEIEKRDKVRAEYYNYFTFGNWGVASNYDLCIDSSILGIKGTADLVIEFARKKGLLE